MSDDMHRVAEELRRADEMLHEMRMLNGRDELWAYERDMNALQQVHEAVRRAATLLEQQAAREDTPGGNNLVAAKVDPSVVPRPPADTIARLTRERDEARAQVDKVEKQAAYNAAEAASLADQVNELLAEFKDQLRWLDKGSERYNRVVALIAKAEAGGESEGDNGN